MAGTRTAMSICLLVGTALATSAWTVPPSPAVAGDRQQRGRRIFLRGEGARGPEITATLSGTEVEVPASALPCASCHGHDGRGRPEGGVTPSDIRWTTLTKPYGARHAGGREHPPYTERTLRRAIVEGLDPAGNRLDGAMPRYRIPEAGLEDLVAYLRVLGRTDEPGVGEEIVRVGTILPSGGALRRAGNAVGRLLSAYFEQLGAGGGIYGRRVELVIETYSPEEGPLGAMRRLIDGRRVFAVAAGFLAGADDEVASLAEAAELPLIGPFTLFPQTAPPRRHVFYLFEGLEGQGRALTGYAAPRGGGTVAGLAIVHPQGNLPAATIAALRRAAERAGWGPVDVRPYAGPAADRLVPDLAQEDPAAVLFLGTPVDLRSFAAAASGTDWRPRMLVPGGLIDASIFELPPSFDVLLAYPVLPGDQRLEGALEYGMLAETYGLPAEHRSAQHAAFCAAKLLAEGLKLAGRELTREKLVQALEGLYEFDTGLAPPLSYGPNRRVGVRGAHIVSLDIENRRFSREADRDPAAGSRAWSSLVESER